MNSVTRPYMWAIGSMDIILFPADVGLFLWLKSMVAEKFL